MKPTEKAPAIDGLLKEMGWDRKTAIEQEKCVSCKQDAYAFKNPLSEKEYSISGLCQKCQDRIFG